MGKDMGFTLRSNPLEPKCLKQLFKQLNFILSRKKRLKARAFSIQILRFLCSVRRESKLKALQILVTSGTKLLLLIRQTRILCSHKHMIADGKHIRSVIRNQESEISWLWLFLSSLEKEFQIICLLTTGKTAGLPPHQPSTINHQSSWSTCLST